METRAITRFVRLTPQKARLVLGLIRGKRAEAAMAILEYTPKRGARIVLKTLRSAVANAESTQRVDVDTLYVKRAFADAGPTAKRFLPRAHGRATKIFKRTTHITVVVGTRDRYVAEADVERETARLAAAGILPGIRRFEGGHRVDRATLSGLSPEAP